jgi:hypothetical protein
VKQVVIENPVINSPFDEPNRHFRFTDEGITNDGRRSSSYFVPIARPRKKGQKQLEFDTEWTQDRIEENKLVNQIRARVKLWREGGYIGVTPTTTRLLVYWTDPDREKKLFFCQIEAIETSIYLTEVAKRYGDAWIENDLRQANDSSNPGLPRVAFKMATGTGKTVVMAMLIAWHTLNKLANPQDARFSDAFLIVTPGITIRDRLRVLLPNDPQNYYRQRDIVPNQSMDQLGQAKILITNFHGLQLREKVTAGKLTKAILAEGETGAFFLAKLTLEEYFRDDDGNDKPWLFPQVLNIAKRWLAECVVLKDNTFPQLLLLIEFAHDAADRIYGAIVKASEGDAALKPILRAYDTIGSTRYVDFDTTRPVYSTREDKCHVSYTVLDSNWESTLEERLEDMDEVVRYVKNHNLGFTIPYSLNGEARNYIPDFIACIDDGHGPDDLLNLLIEVTGEHKKDKAAKVSAARTLWVPAVNNHGGFGRWAFIEITDPWDAGNTIRASLQQEATKQGTQS